ncbi:hypothetical protein C5E45_22965 [Nocardia nova]|uniref:DUF86 domain-containing protein n=1 Tax=Nocardia nova TaxID=37330 RepID=A0A2S6AL90_9NOCA|nr:hypothetical protein [Nocardia nova]PPJ31724.1 hypothetical protein C5E41_07505 [Nocardia nova]PPJ35963.1 hypothetical protein C5E45_22965 [Nocardia nova]
MAQQLTLVRSRLGTADMLISDATADLDGLWPRASAWTLRIAVEHAIEELWNSVSPRMVSVTRRAQLLVLPKYIGAQAAGEASVLWAELSVVTHHHDYELNPTVQQLRRWQESSERVVAAIDAAMSAHTGASR